MCINCIKLLGNKIKNIKIYKNWRFSLYHIYFYCYPFYCKQKVLQNQNHFLSSESLIITCVKLPGPYREMWRRVKEGIWDEFSLLRLPVCVSAPVHFIPFSKREDWSVILKSDYYSEISPITGIGNPHQREFSKHCV